MRRLFYILVLLMGELSMSAQMNIKLTLDEAIALANDSSLTAFRYRNMY